MNCKICSKQYLCNKKECKPIKYSTLHKDNYGVPKRINKNIFDLDIEGFEQQVDSFLDNYTEDELLGELIQNGLKIERKEEK